MYHVRIMYHISIMYHVDMHHARTRRQLCSEGARAQSQGTMATPPAAAPDAAAAASPSGQSSPPAAVLLGLLAHSVVGGWGWWIMVGFVVGHGWGVLDHGWVFCGSCLGGSRACQAAERAQSVASAAARRGGLDPAETGEPRLVSLICERDIGGARARVENFPQEVSGHVNGTRSFTYLCTKLNAFEQVSN